MPYIDKKSAIDALKAIRYGLWEIDIPSPTVPEYVEHHEQIKNMLEITDGWIKKLEEQSTADVVGRYAYDQVRWERDVAIAQLASIGKGFGEAMDDVGKVVRCKDCKHFQCRHWCGSCDPTDFCSHGERKESE